MNKEELLGLLSKSRFLIGSSILILIGLSDQPGKLPVISQPG